MHRPGSGADPDENAVLASRGQLAKILYKLRMTYLTDRITQRIVELFELFKYPFLALYDEINFLDWGRKAESEDRLKLIIDEYFRVEEERLQAHPRKTIVFAVSERQAVILERLFNRLLPDAACLRIATQTNRSPGEVRQSFAQSVIWLLPCANDVFLRKAFYSDRVVAQDCLI